MDDSCGDVTESACGYVALFLVQANLAVGAGVRTTLRPDIQAVDDRYELIDAMPIESTRHWLGLVAWARTWMDVRQLSAA